MKQIASVEDDSLIAGVADGNMDMLGMLYERYSVMVKKALRRSAPEMPSAVVDELAQEVFIVVHDNAGRYRYQMKARAYLYGIAVKKASTWRRNTWLRRKLLNRATEENKHLAPHCSVSPVDQAALKETVAQALSRLPEKQRTVLLLHAVEGFSGDEISQILKIKPKTVRTRLFRARKSLSGNVNKEQWLSVLGKVGP